MRTWLSVLAIVGISTSYAFGSGLGGFGSYWDSKDADSTWGAGAILRIDLDESLQLDIRGSYYQFDDREFGVKWELDVIPVEVALMIKLPVDDTITPYIGGGAGYYFADSEFRAEGEKLKLDIDDEFGFFAVGGIEVKVGDALSLFAEAKYVWLEFDKAKFKNTGIPELDNEKFDIDLKMDGLAVNIGLLLRF